MAHEHRFYFQTTKKEFEPVDPEIYDQENLYLMKEYAILMCNCTEVKKVIVKKGTQFDDD